MPKTVSQSQYVSHNMKKGKDDQVRLRSHHDPQGGRREAQGRRLGGRRHLGWGGEEEGRGGEEEGRCGEEEGGCAE